MTDEAARLEEILARIRRMEDAVGKISGALGALTQACQRRSSDILFSQVAYLGDHRALTYLHTGQKLFVDTRSIDIGTHLMYGGQWEQEYATAFLRLLKPGDVVLDIGSNHGVYALLAATRVTPGGHIFAFEPSRSFYDLICASVSVNGIEHLVTVVQQAAADRTRTTTLVANAQWSGGAHLAVRPGAEEPDNPARPVASETIECVALDDYFADPAQQVDVIKMDIEGAEGLALKGMVKLVDRSPSLKLLMEFSPRMMARFECGADYVVDFLDSRGFMCWTVNADGSLAPARWQSLLADPNAIRNIVLSRQGLG
ncbi:MAG: FkbM family methyltransferase [Betaproteobacteria bacterium]